MAAMSLGSIPARGPALGGRALAAILLAVLVSLHAESAHAALRTFGAAADAYSRSDAPDVNFGSSVRFSADGASPIRRAYLRFNVQIPDGSTVVGAVLGLSTVTSADATGVDLRGVADDAWGEGTLTYRTAPAHGEVVAHKGAFAAGSWIDLDASALVKAPGAVSMALTTTGTGYRAFDSRETPAGPQLVVRTVPDTVITNGPGEGGAAPTASATFGFSATETLSAFACRLDEAAWSQCTSPVTYGDLADGPHVFEVRAADAAGGDPTPARRSWTVDTRPPETTIDPATSPRPITTATAARFDLGANEQDVRFEASLDGAPFESHISPATYADLADGAHRFEVRAVDPAGNADPTPAAWAWTVDTVAPPRPAIAVPAEGSVTSMRTVAVAGSAEQRSIVVLFADGAVAAAVAADEDGDWTADLADLADGPHELVAVAFDEGGNVSEPAARRFAVDSVPPETVIVSAPAAVSNVSEPSFRFSGSEPDVHFQCRRDGKAFAACTSPKRYSTLLDGDHTFQVRAVDAAGNIDASPAGWSWTVDTVAPSVSITGPPGGSVFTTDGTVDITADAHDALGITRTEFWDGGTRRLTLTSPPYRYPWKLSASKAGRHRWTVRSYDTAGNVAVSSAADLDVNIVAATAETDPVPDDKDAADDPAVWVHPSDPALSTVVATDKRGGLAVYDLAGRQLDFYADSRPNNVDLRNGFPFSGGPGAVVVTTDRSTSSLRMYRVDPQTRKLLHVGAVPTEPNLYGLCLYRSPASGRHFAFITHDDGTIRQWELSAGVTGTVAASVVRTFAVPGAKAGGEQIAEGCVADDERGVLYVAEEDTAIWRFGAEPADTGPPIAVDTTSPGGHLAADIEGLAIYYAPGGAGYLLASSQGSSEFAIYERSGANRFVEKFGIGAGAFDKVADSDGIEVVSVALGSAFPAGVLVAHDGYNPLATGGDRQNFKLVPWSSLARNLAVPLVESPNWDPRFSR